MTSTLPSGTWPSLRASPRRTSGGGVPGGTALANCAIRRPSSSALRAAEASLDERRPRADERIEHRLARLCPLGQQPPAQERMKTRRVAVKAVRKLTRVGRARHRQRLRKDLLPARMAVAGEAASL